MWIQRHSGCCPLAHESGSWIKTVWLRRTLPARLNEKSVLCGQASSMGIGAQLYPGSAYKRTFRVVFSVIGTEKLDEASPPVAVSTSPNDFPSVGCGSRCT